LYAILCALPDNTGSLKSFNTSSYFFYIEDITLLLLLKSFLALMQAVLTPHYAAVSAHQYGLSEMLPIIK
jgi:hypothetical protein